MRSLGSSSQCRAPASQPDHFDLNCKKHHASGPKADQQLHQSQRLCLENGVQWRRVNGRHLQPKGEEHCTQQRPIAQACTSRHSPARSKPTHRMCCHMPWAKRLSLSARGGRQLLRGGHGVAPTQRHPAGARDPRPVTVRAGSPQVTIRTAVHSNSSGSGAGAALTIITGTPAA